MTNQFGFIFKLLFISAGLSILIKYGGSNLSLPATQLTVLTLVLLPTFVMAIILGLRYTNAEWSKDK